MFKKFLHNLQSKTAPDKTSACGPADELQEKLRQWYQFGLGQHLAHEECEKLEQILPTLFGYHLAQIGYLCKPEYFQASYIRNKFVLDTDLKHHNENICLYGEPHNLPLESDSIDLVILPHTLEMHSTPHKVLREAERVLMPEGHIIILGFNPWSLWGLRKLVWRRRDQVPWCAKFITPMRVKDWLSLLGFDQESFKTFNFSLPVNNEHFLRRTARLNKLGQQLWPAFGSVYMFVAKKRVSTLTPIGPVFQPKPRMVAPGLVETRQSNE
jgi:SAM-dependent methyltransferase